MTWWHRLWRRRQMEDQLEKELRFHLDAYAADLVTRGHDPGEAPPPQCVAEDRHFGAAKLIVGGLQVSPQRR